MVVSSLRPSSSATRSATGCYDGVEELGEGFRLPRSVSVGDEGRGHATGAQDGLEISPSAGSAGPREGGSRSVVVASPLVERRSVLPLLNSGGS